MVISIGKTCFPTCTFKPAALLLVAYKIIRTITIGIQKAFSLTSYLNQKTVSCSHLIQHKQLGAAAEDTETYCLGNLKLLCP